MFQLLLLLRVREGREHANRFWYHLNFDGRRPENFAIAVKETRTICGQTYTRRAGTGDIRPRKIPAGEQSRDGRKHFGGS